MQTSEPETSPKNLQSKRKRSLRFLGLILALAFLGWMSWRYWHNLTHVSSDNAQVAGHVVPILPRVSGYLTTVAVEENQRVVAGTLLVAIDDRDYRARLNQAEAELQIAFAAAGKEGHSGQAEAQLAAARASASAARSNIDQMLANADRAQKDLERNRALLEKKMISQQALDAAEASARAALAQVRSARETASSAGEQVSASNAALRGALSRVEAARANRDLAAIQLADTRILAPLTGIIGSRTVVPGQLVQAGQPLLNMVSEEQWVVANLKETDIGRIKAGQETQIRVDAYPGVRFHGRVESLSPASGALFSLLPPDNATGNFTKVVQRIPIRIALAKSDLGHILRPGMSAVVTIDTR